jgi:ATP-binding cassette subfamily B protein AbcA/BmrA
LENVIGTQITIGISNDIKYKIFSHILHLKAKEQDQYSTGELLNRTEGDADAVVSYYINVITSWIMIIINLTVSIYFLLKISKMLTGIGILLLPVNYLINFLFRNRIKIYKLKEKQKEDGYFKFVNIALSSLKNIKVLLLEKFFSHKFLEIKDEQYKIEIKNVYLSSLINFLQQFFNQIFEVIIIFISAVFIIKGILSIGMMVSFNSYLEKLFNAISRLISLNLEKQTLAISLERINDIQSKEKEIVNENQPIKINKIEFSHVSFKYDKNEVLRDICFTINENGLYSIVGENGSGKTTILKLIDKLYVISKGEIFINDINIDELELGKLRRSISYMMKDNLIMPTSLYENIILGCDRVPDNDYLEELCQMLQLNELKNRIGGLWGEINGDMLSSGEKQKVGLARALVNGSRICDMEDKKKDGT